MIMGCTSDAGKSFLVTALCRYFANRGIRYIEGNRKCSPTRLTAGRGTRQKSNACAARPPVARGRLAVWTLKN